MTKKLIIALMAVSLLSFGSVAAFAGAPNLSGIAYIQGHGGHVAVLNLATGDVKRIVHGKPSDALTLSKNRNMLYVFSLDGYAKEINLKTGKQTNWTRLGKQHCGSNIAPDGTIWVSDMKDGHVYVYDPKKHKLVDSFPVSKSICGITFTKDGKTAYIADMPGSFINIVDVKTKKVIGKTGRIGNFIHRGRLNPAGTEIWESEGNELKGGKPYGVGYAEAGGQPGGVIIIDVKTGKKKDFVLTGGNVHDIDFTPDGRYALAATRQVPEQDDSGIVVIDTKTKRVVKVYSACKKCHGALGVVVPDNVDNGRPFLCGIQVNWKKTSFGKACE
ncbi:PQQ enzyme repeat protein [bacterium BMS3Abin07]|nr:PQQ enzyme repeat protein [bacterium BMS3Abin07]GBE31278.1 PQQ enzyme repeat protein [bacterium BMS3Bbin05]HDL21144.1 hypothetical protein [Nitrospirota bacterium]HDO23588.1 hypothetical protein [Nitrospirota bacterium]HDZ88890.1 hypothetical protein [Nitrospirota bacterium]